MTARLTLLHCAALCITVMHCAASARDLTLPDAELTPGVATTATAAELCAKTYHTKDARSVTPAMKRQVFKRYGLSGNHDPACVPATKARRCEIDHLISLELGGANDIKNLWPQPFGTQPFNATLKDKVENRLHKEVCNGNLTLEAAQKEISTDWRIPFIRYFGEPK